MEELLNKFKWAAIDYNTVLNMPGVPSTSIQKRLDELKAIRKEILDEFNKRSA